MLKLEACFTVLVTWPEIPATSTYTFIATTALVIQNPRQQIEANHSARVKQALDTALPTILAKRKFHPKELNLSSKLRTPHKGTPASPYPTPVEGAGKVVPSAKWKDSHRRWGAEL